MTGRPGNAVSGAVCQRQRLRRPSCTVSPSAASCSNACASTGGMATPAAGPIRPSYTMVYRKQFFACLPFERAFLSIPSRNRLPLALSNRGEGSGCEMVGIKPPVRVCVIGDEGVGKTSLITAAATESFPDSPPPTLPTTKLPPDSTPEGVPVQIFDTCSRPEERPALEVPDRCSVQLLHRPRLGAVRVLTRHSYSLARRPWPRVPCASGLCLDHPFPRCPHPRAQLTSAMLPQMSCLNADVIVLLFATDRPQTLSRVSSYWMPELRRLQVTVPVVLVGTKSDLKPNEQQLQQVRQRRHGCSARAAVLAAVATRANWLSVSASNLTDFRAGPYGHRF